MTIILGYDATHDNVAHLPRGVVAGYTTGTGGIPWTVDDWAAHPGAIRIDQDPVGRDSTADVFDVERGAGTNGAAPGWYRRALDSFYRNLRPGQRRPCFYTSMSNVTPLVNALIAGGVTSGPRLWIANWSLSEAQARNLIANASGPFPIVGVQYANNPQYDTSVWSTEYLSDVSRALVSATKGAGMFLAHARGYDDVYLLGGPVAPVVHVESPSDLGELLPGLVQTPMSVRTIEKYFGKLPNTPTPA